MSGDVQIRQLEYLLALARERHFSRAAAACHVSQSALSAAMRKLEAELGVTITERGHRFTGFTAEGAQVVEWAERILAKRDALRSDLIRMHHGITDTLRIGVIPTAAPVAALLTSAFHERNPRSRLRIETSSSQEIVQRLARFDLDAGLVYLDEHPIPGAHGFRLYRERYILLTAANGPLGERRTVRWAEAAQLPLCALTPAMQHRTILAKAMAMDGARLEPMVETDTMDALHAHLRTTRWSSIIAHSSLHGFRVPPGMRAIPLVGIAARPRVGIIIGDRQPVSILAGALLDTARELDVSAELERAAIAILTAAGPGR